MTASRWRLVGLLSPLVAAAAALLAWSQAWVVVHLVDDRSVVVGGDVAAPALPPFAIAALALVGALALAGVFFRVVLGVLQALLGLGVSVSGLLVVTDPVASSAPAITEVSGLAGVDSVRTIVAAVDLTPWPSLAVVAGVLGIAAGVLVVVSAQRWPRQSRRYDAVRLVAPDGLGDETAHDQVSPVDTTSAWDSLSDGDDPTNR